MTDKRNLSLLELLAESAGCLCLSDLRCIQKQRHHQLAERIEAISAEDYPLSVWNDALMYLTSAGSAHTSEDARQRIIDCYRNNKAMPLTQTPQGGSAYEK